ncbi:MAG: class I SAM-dependent methyltransferase, partial [Bdellovibrionales bacterium]|nr:class I SAM-dependent methyltransferase [Bdellovibrionales bacterium]
VTGVDLSEPMLNVARNNAQTYSSQLNFVKGDITHVPELTAHSVQLVTCLNALHHVPSLGALEKAYSELDRICDPKGMIITIDLIRPKNNWILENFVKLTATENARKNQYAISEDYFYSLHAAFTPSEHIASLPQNSERNWFVVVPAVTPVYQIVIGLPKEQKQLKMGMNLDKKMINAIVPKDLRTDLKVLSLLTHLKAPKALEHRAELSLQKAQKLKIAA